MKFQGIVISVLWFLLPEHFNTLTKVQSGSDVTQNQSCIADHSREDRVGHGSFNYLRNAHQRSQPPLNEKANLNNPEFSGTVTGVTKT